jgi:hypothetical protein
MRTNIKKQAIQGLEIESWYNEGACNWEAFVKGSGSATDSFDREGAIDGVIALHDSTFCPSCKSKGSLGILRGDDSARGRVGLYCTPCGYAQSKVGSREWYFMVGGIKVN